MQCRMRSIVARSASAVTTSEKKVQLSLIGSRLYALSNEPMMNSIRCPKSSPRVGGGVKTKNDRFPSKSALHLKKVCYKVSLCEYCQLSFTRLTDGRTDWRIDGRTDGFTILNRALHTIQRGKNCRIIIDVAGTHFCVNWLNSRQNIKSYDIMVAVGASIKQSLSAYNDCSDPYSDNGHNSAHLCSDWLSSTCDYIGHR